MSWGLLKNSLLVGGGAALGALAIGFVMALGAAALEPGRRRGVTIGALMVLALPPFVVTNTWLHFFGLNGVWRRWVPFDILSVGGAVWLLSLMLWPIAYLAVLGAWQRLESAEIEAEPVLEGWRLIRVVLLPLCRGHLVTAGGLTFVLALNNFAVPAILQIKVFPAEMWIRFNTSFDTLGVLALAWPLVVGPLLLLAIVHRRGFRWPHLGEPVAPRSFRRQLGTGWWRVSAATTLLVGLLCLGLPLAQLAFAGRTWTELPGAVVAGRDALWNSCGYAGISATLVVLLGFLLRNAVPGSRRGRANGENLVRALGGPLAAGLVWLPFLLPGVLLGIGLIAAFNHAWSERLYQSAGIVLVAFTVRYFALGWSATGSALQAVDGTLVEAARLDGANRRQMFALVYWPQISGTLLATWYIVFLLCLWDVESMILVVPPGGETLAVRVFNLLHYGHNAQVNALCLTLLGVAVAPLLLWKSGSTLRALAGRMAGPAARGGAPAVVVAALGCGLALGLTGCSPEPRAGEAALESGLFTRARVIGSRGVGVGELNKPRSVAVDRQDNVFVVDMTGRVQKFDSNGVFVLSWQMPQTDKGRPKGMCRGPAGEIIVNEPHYSRVNEFSPAGQLLDQWGTHGTNRGQLAFPRAVAVDSRKEMFVSEYGLTERVQKFQLPEVPGGAATFVLAFGRMGEAPGEFNRPEGLCVDAQDRVYVADSCNHRIQVFDRDGKFLRAHGKAGKGRGELSYPYDICVDAAGRQYVCEFGNSRIQVFDAQDQSLEIIGGPGARPGEFSNPWGVALDSEGNLYVADSQNHRLQKLLRRGGAAGSDLAVVKKKPGG